VQQDPAAALAGARAAPVGEPHHAGGGPAAWGASDVEEPLSQSVGIDDLVVQGAVDGDDGGLVRKAPSQVEGRADRIGDLPSVQLDHLVVTQPGHVAVQAGAGVGRGPR
jgi:hypothetical protein